MVFTTLLRDFFGKMDKKDKALRHIDKNGCGIEIGPARNPLAPKAEGYKVHIIDHITREQLVAKYKGNNTDVIEEVDFIWQGESYTDLTGKKKYYDWVIASHVIEHTPDLVGFLNECDSILKDDGVISLIVPDKRYCFDHFRPNTGISKIIDSHFQKSTMHTPGAVAEFYLTTVSQAGRIVWNSNSTGDYKFLYSLDNALKEMNSVINDNSYHDTHAWCFTPHSFRLIIHDLFCLGLISFKEVDFYPSVGCEFFITLSRKGKGIKKSRIEMLEIVQSELCNAN